ncbi:MAG: phage holin family protein [Clostridium butyricum]|nr:phage holin family protein [Clostridium butyricum]
MKSKKVIKIEEKAIILKSTLVTIAAYLSSKLGILSPIIVMLIIVLIIDYLTGMLSAFQSNVLNSKTGLWGIVKKLLYGVAVAVGMIVDWTIINVAEVVNINMRMTTFFGLLVAIWLIINELISILENLMKLDVPLPSFLIKVVSSFKMVVENSGDSLADTIDKNNKKNDE